jgi:hypothetical protein
MDASTTNNPPVLTVVTFTLMALVTTFGQQLDSIAPRLDVRMILCQVLSLTHSLVRWLA